MSNISEVPGSIEGREIIVTGLKITPSGLPIQLDTSDIVFPVTITRRASGEITKEHSPKKHKFNPSSMLNVSDKIAGKHIWGFSSSPITKKSICKGEKGRSGRHTGQYLYLSNNCYAEIIHGWRGDALPNHPKNKFISE